MNSLTREILLHIWVIFVLFLSINLATSCNYICIYDAADHCYTKQEEQIRSEVHIPYPYHIGNQRYSDINTMLAGNTQRPGEIWETNAFQRTQSPWNFVVVFLQDKAVYCSSEKTIYIWHQERMKYEPRLTFRVSSNIVSVWLPTRM